jgi:hypothetical protein
MYRRAEKIVCRASYRDPFSAVLSRVSFSTASDVSPKRPSWSAGRLDRNDYSVKFQRIRKNGFIEGS